MARARPMCDSEDSRWGRRWFSSSQWHRSSRRLYLHNLHKSQHSPTVSLREKNHGGIGGLLSGGTEAAPGRDGVANNQWVEGCCTCGEGKRRLGSRRISQHRFHGLMGPGGVDMIKGSCLFTREWHVDTRCVHCLHATADRFFSASSKTCRLPPGPDAFRSPRGLSITSLIQCYFRATFHRRHIFNTPKI